MRNVYPAFRSLYRNSSRAVLYFGESVINSRADNGFLSADNGVGYILAKSEAYSSAASRLNKIVLRAGIERIFSVDKFGMKNYVALLGRARLEIRKSFPCNKVLCANDSRLRNRCGKVAAFGILAFGAEHAVDPAVLMLSNAHIVNVGFFGAGVRKLYRIITETEAVYTVVTLGNGEKRFAVVALNANDKAVLPVQLYSSRVERGVYAEALHKIRIRFIVEVVFPDKRRMSSRKNGVFIAFVNAVVKIRFFIFSVYQRLIFFGLFLNAALKFFFSGHKKSFQMCSEMFGVHRTGFPHKMIKSGEEVR